MPRREWRKTAVALGCIALLSAVMTGWVMMKERPENIAAFEERFSDMAGLGFAAQTDGLALQADTDALTFSWEAGGEEELRAVSKPIPMEKGAREAQLSVYVSGTRNAQAQRRWGWQLWLEWTAVSPADGSVLEYSRIELPLESDKERARACSVSVRIPAGDAAACTAALVITPLNGVREAGTVTLAHWEVAAK